MRMNLERAQESLRAAELCLQAGYVNSAASRAYYAMFQAAQVALEAVDIGRAVWSHSGVQATFTTELIHRRKMYPLAFRNYLSSGLEVRQMADYEPSGVSRKVAQRLVRRAATFVTAVEEAMQR
jgi:uncharacterized protein (UPF0332 family)